MSVMPEETTRGSEGVPDMYEALIWLWACAFAWPGYRFTLHVFSRLEWNGSFTINDLGG